MKKKVTIKSWQEIDRTLIGGYDARTGTYFSTAMQKYCGTTHLAEFTIKKKVSGSPTFDEAVYIEGWVFAESWYTVSNPTVDQPISW